MRRGEWNRTVRENHQVIGRLLLAKGGDGCRSCTPGTLGASSLSTRELSGSDHSRLTANNALRRGLVCGARRKCNFCPIG